ncbi:MAG: hypothetical protein K6A35_08805 [bacterium]|nr:hypothetical protein [bacterium]
MSDNIIQIDCEVMKGELSELVRQSVEDVINTFLGHEADVLVNASVKSKTFKRQPHNKALTALTPQWAGFGELAIGTTFHML